MKSLDPGAIAALESGRYAVRALCLFDLPSGRWGIFDDDYDLSWSGDTYIGAAGRFTLQLPPTAADLSERGLTVTLSALDGAALAWVQDQSYRQRPMFAALAIIGTDTPQILHVKKWFSGFVDRVVWQEKIDGEARLLVHCESHSRELDRAGTRARTDADQRLRDPDDGFFKMTVAAIAREIEWGATEPQKPSSNGKKWYQKIF